MLVYLKMKKKNKNTGTGTGTGVSEEKETITAEPQSLPRTAIMEECLLRLCASKHQILQDEGKRAIQAITPVFQINFDSNPK